MVVRKAAKAKKAEVARNRHPVDQLADVRASIKNFQGVESYLKDQIAKMAIEIDVGKFSVSGDEWYCNISYQTRKTLDRVALEQAVGVPTVEKCLKKTESLVFRLESRARGELDS